MKTGELSEIEILKESNGLIEMNILFDIDIDERRTFQVETYVEAEKLNERGIWGVVNSGVNWVSDENGNIKNLDCMPEGESQAIDDCLELNIHSWIEFKKHDQYESAMDEKADRKREFRLDS